MYYKNIEEEKKILWFAESEKWERVNRFPILNEISATWFDEGKSWSSFILEENVYNSDIQEYIHKHGI